MAAEQGQAPNADAFDAYFRRADLDQDGRISGAEAVAFFQGSNLPKETLALVWSYAAGGNNYLGRLEFYNALRLVTVAQSGRQLTADLVKAALYGPAAAKIPAPEINLTSASATQANQLLTQPTQMNSMAVSHMAAAPFPQSSQSGFMRPPASQLNSMAPTSIQANSMMQQPPQAGFMRPSSQINSTVTLTPQANQPAQAGLMRPPASLKTGLTGQPMPITMGLNYQGSPAMQNNFTRPTQASQVSASHPVQGFSQGLPAGAVNSQVPKDKDGFGAAHSNQEATSKLQIQHVISSPITSRPLDPVSTSFQSTSRDSNTLGVSGNGFSSNSIFGGDAFLAAQTNRDASIPISSTSSLSRSSNLAPVDPKNSVNAGQHANLQVMPGLPPAANQLQRNHSPIKQNQLEAMQNSSALPVHNVPIGSDSSVSTQNEVPWPKITQSDIRKYTKVFLEVDKDRDGKITGIEARNLFLSWRLPREILKQVWDLSDQDNDSMLSMREFCVALYLMERYREGRPLPSVLPNSVKFDQILILATGQPSSAYGASAWQPRPALPQQPTPEKESLSVVPPNRVESSTRTPIPSHLDDVVSPVQPKTRVPVLEQNMVNQLSEEEKNALNSKLQEATNADTKVQELEKEILDCKQKTENYRKQMQELVLYKSRCDSRLNEIIERVTSDKREVELLAKKYEEKYKQTGDVASKLNVDQATFRDIQERKMELYSAIVKMEQGELSDGVLQERAEKIQTDLDELVKALNERCKDNGLRSKPTSLVELPFGWQPGIQEGVADWDESWDKFDKDDGFTVIKELTLEMENVVAPEKLKSTLVTSVPAATTISNESDKVTKDREPASFSNVEGKIDKSLTTGGLLTEAELSNMHGEDGSVRSPPGSSGRSTIESPSREFQSTFSPHAYAKEHHRFENEFDGPESTISEEKFTNEVTWGATFDSDDTDSLWGFNPIKTKEAFNIGSRLDSFSGSLGADSPSASSVFGRDRGPFFDSVPSTPLFNSDFSPRFNEGDDHHNFDTFGRFDSFNMNENTIFPSSGTLTRFDSMNSTTDQSRDAFSRFDSFRSTADTQREFSRFDSMIGAAEPPRETLARFDSIRSTGDYNRGFSFDDSDPFGSGLFRTSESHNTPKKNTTDQWSSF